MCVNVYVCLCECIQLDSHTPESIRFWPTLLQMVVNKKKRNTKIKYFRTELGRLVDNGAKCLLERLDYNVLHCLVGHRRRSRQLVVDNAFKQSSIIISQHT